MSSRTSALLCSVVLILFGVGGCQKEPPTKPEASAPMESPRRLEPQIEPLPPRETPAETPEPAAEAPEGEPESPETGTAAP